MTLPGDAFMNSAVTIVWVTLALGTGTGAAAQAPSPGPQFRIAFVKSREILQSTPGYAAAESTFNKEVQGFRDEVQKLQHQLDSAVQAFDQQSIALSPTAKQAKQKELQSLQQRVEQRSNELQDRAAQRERAARAHPAARQLGGAGAPGRRELRADLRRGRARLEHRGGGSGARPDEQGRAAPAAES